MDFRRVWNLRWMRNLESDVPIKQCDNGRKCKMKNVVLILLFPISISVYSQSSDSIINCNDKWLNELVKTGSLSIENSKQDFLCYLGIFDSLENSKVYTKFELLHAIGNLSKYSDGAFSEGLFYKSFEYLFTNPDSFFTIMKKENKSGMKNWARMVYYEFANRSASEINFSNYIIVELEKNIKDTKIKSWKLFQKVLKEIEKEHTQQFNDFYRNKE